MGVLGVLQSTLRPENRTPDLELSLARTALCWPPGNAGYKWSLHQSTTPARKLYDVAPQKAGYKSICSPENCSSWEDSMPASGGWSLLTCGRSSQDSRGLDCLVRKWPSLIIDRVT